MLLSENLTSAVTATGCATWDINYVLVQQESNKYSFATDRTLMMSEMFCSMPGDQQYIQKLFLKFFFWTLLLFSSETRMHFPNNFLP